MSITACSTCTLLQSASSSSATIIGSDVFTPCPTSGFFANSTTVPSVLICTNEVASRDFRGLEALALEILQVRRDVRIGLEVVGAHDAPPAFAILSAALWIA